MKCLLERDVRNARTCKMSNCDKCGWCESVYEARMELLQTDGLTVGDDGIARLVLPVDPTQPVTD